MILFVFFFLLKSNKFDEKNYDYNGIDDVSDIFLLKLKTDDEFLM